eukprot:c51756_g1_i1 orf=386-649(+)
MLLRALVHTSCTMLILVTWYKFQNIVQMSGMCQLCMISNATVLCTMSNATVLLVFGALIGKELVAKVQMSSVGVKCCFTFLPLNILK